MLRIFRRTAKAPVSDDQRTLIEDGFAWFGREFSWESASGPVVLPTIDFMPPNWTPTDEEIDDLLLRTCDYMKIDPERVALTIFDDDEDPVASLVPAYEREHSGPAGLFFDEEHEGRFLIAVAERAVMEAGPLMATFAHELAHVHLVGDKRISAEDERHERLTDLLAIFFGLGIFTANSAFQFAQWSEGDWQGWSASRLGYMDEPSLGYSLAAYAWIRAESKPPWAKYLAHGVGTYFRKSQQYLEAGGPTDLPRGAAIEGSDLSS